MVLNNRLTHCIPTLIRIIALLNCECHTSNSNYHHMSPTCCQQLRQRAHNTFTQASYNATQCQSPFHIVSSSHDYPLQPSTATLTTYLMNTVITQAHRSPSPHANSPGPRSRFTTAPLKFTTVCIIASNIDLAQTRQSQHLPPAEPSHLPAEPHGQRHP